MINPNIKFSFNQFETALVAFVSDFRKKIQNIVYNCPVFIMNTGDFSYYNGKKWVETTMEEIYLKTPRIVIKIDDIQSNSNEDTNVYNRIEYIHEGLNYTCNCRRKAHNITISIQVVSPNYISMLNNYEAVSVFASRDNVFSYEFAGNSYESAYVFSSSSIEMPSMDVSSASRNVVVTFNCELQVHLFVPDIDSIMLLDDSKSAGMRFDVIQHGYETNSIPMYDGSDTETSLETIPKVPYTTDNKVIENQYDIEPDENKTISDVLNGTELARKKNLK